MAQGWRPNERVRPDDLLATVSLRDTLQHVERETWAAMHLMADLPVRGEVLAGNPPICTHVGGGAAPDTPPLVDNGILALVAGALVGAGSQQLPTPGLAEAAQSRREAVVHVPSVGPVRITYELRQHRHGRGRHWSWAAVRADRVG